MRFLVTIANAQCIETQIGVEVEDEFALEELAEDMELHEGVEFFEAVEVA